MFGSAVLNLKVKRREHKVLFLFREILDASTLVSTVPQNEIQPGTCNRPHHTQRFARAELCLPRKPNGNAYRKGKPNHEPNTHRQSNCRHCCEREELYVLNETPPSLLSLAVLKWRTTWE